MDATTWAAIRLAFEAEAAFGIDLLPRGATSTRPAVGAPRAAPDVPAATVAPREAAPADPETRLADLAARIAACEACTLCTTRTRTVPGQGDARARLMFVGEAPGADEDREGLAFVGKAGQLLTRMIAAMGLKREEVFIANVLKCRPPENRDPLPEEARACWGFLREQIDVIRPEVICTLGRHAAAQVLERDEPMHRLRGRIFELEDVKVVPTYHPSYLLRSPDKKAQAWADLQVVMKLLGLARP